MQGTPPPLARLSSRLGVPAFQYNIYGTTSEFLMEVDAGGRVELSGCVGHDVTLLESEREDLVRWLG
ncbi:uncharacterized protein STAUR_2741 [Stigmatella aurantiaca DW4/3-1]|uniref:Uncharacterized protein n=1 Tax=Stigmatella aurantiaca (strain DW4/3-1) TaxID=378806 RepID=E3FL21_STIAD|nr:uncharacterized protein STAUR_2741 [Stigmatella aurantiaca DW4/3-1]